MSHGLSCGYWFYHLERATFIHHSHRVYIIRQEGLLLSSLSSKVYKDSFVYTKNVDHGLKNTGDEELKYYRFLLTVGKK